MTLTDLLLDMIHDGPASIAQMQDTFPQYTRQQIENALGGARRNGLIHCVRDTGNGPGVYVRGPAPDWLPNPLPVRCVWELAAV